MRLSNAFICLLAALSPFAFAATDAAPQRPLVYVSIPPQAWILEQLAGNEDLDVRVLLPAASGHVNYTPTPSQIRDLARAKMFVRSGLPFENRMWDRIRRLNPGMIVVDIPVTGSELADESDGEHHHDPHFWLDPTLMLAQAESIAGELPGAADVDQDAVKRNFARLRDRLNAIDAEIRDRVEHSANKSFWTFHGSWGHFADRYGLVQHALEFEGKESGLRTMIELVSELKDSGADFIVVEPGLDRQRLAVLKNEANLTYVELNPMRRDYDKNLSDVAAALTGDAG